MFCSLKKITCTISKKQGNEEGKQEQQQPLIFRFKGFTV